MAKFSIMLFGFDSYTKSRMWLPYKLEAEKADAAVREARARAGRAYPEFVEDETFCTGCPNQKLRSL